MKSDHWSPAELLERAKHLQQLAAEKGSASETLEKYPHHYTMLAFRNRNGGGEPWVAGGESSRCASTARNCAIDCAPKAAANLSPDFSRASRLRVRVLTDCTPTGASAPGPL